jgi:UDP-3-O-[3-hydroxymyristoyl] glucosamine N-acyltransferase
VYSLEELATKLGAEYSGDPGRRIKGLATLAGAGPGDLAFLANRRYLSQLQSTRAGAVILRPEHVGQCPSDSLLTTEPYLTYARATRLFARTESTEPGVHPRAAVAVDATVHPQASIGANVVVEAGVVIEAGVVLGANVYVGRASRVGAGTRVWPNAVIYHDVRLGRDCVIHSNAVLGSDGFGFARGPDGWEKIEQLGGVRIGDRVEIGAGTTVDRGALDDTVIEDGVIVDNLVQIAHNCRIGKNTAIAGCTGLAGSTIIGENCTLAGGVGVLGHLEICNNVHITAMTMVTKSIEKPGSYSSGTPMASTGAWKRNAVRFSQLDSIQRRLAALEKPSAN